jgi:hypothetical protein
LAGGPNLLKQTSQTRGCGKIIELHFIVRLRKKNSNSKKAAGAGFTYSFEVECKRLSFMPSMCFRLLFNDVLRNLVWGIIGAGWTL